MKSSTSAAPTHFCAPAFAVKFDVEGIRPCTFHVGFHGFLLFSLKLNSQQTEGVGKTGAARAGCIPHCQPLFRRF